MNILSRIIKTKKSWVSQLTVNYRRVHLMDCLNDEPDFEQYELDDELIGVVYDGTHQCQMINRGERNYTRWCEDQVPDLGNYSRQNCFITKCQKPS